MKSNFSKSGGWLRTISLLLLLGLMSCPFWARGTDSIAKFTGTITGTPPNVDATNFYNSGSWLIFTAPYPYQTKHTLNYTNEGTMTGSVGWEFDYGPTPAGRVMAGSFFNNTRGTIQSLNGYISYLPNSPYPSLVSYLTISATNVINKGTLIGGVAGNVELSGVNVSLARGTVEIAPDGCIPSQCSSNNFAQTNFTADTAIYDEYWGTNSLNLNSTNFWDGASVTTPYFLVNEPCQQFNVVIPPGTVHPTLADSITNIGVYTNIITTNMDGVTVVTNHEPSQIFKQAVFVGTSDPNIIPADRFYPVNSHYGGDISNLFQTITVRLTSYSGCTLYLVDALASTTNDEFLANVTVLPGSDPQNPLCNDTTFRPGNYILERADCQNPHTFANGSPGFGPPGTNFFYDSSYSNVVVPAMYSAYSGYADDVVRSQSPIAPNTLTNSPGRIVVTASNLDLTHATLISGGTEISLKANNFIGSSDAHIQCRNVSYNLGSTNGTLNIVNLATNTPVPGLHGYVNAWSAVWTNRMITGVFTNYYYVTNSASTNTTGGSGTLTNNVITNFAEVDLNALLVDARSLIATENEKVEDLILHSTNMIVTDSANVQNHLLFDGTSLTVNGSLGLSAQSLPNWDSSIAPSLLYFTNNGTLTVSQDAHFGDDTPTSYAAFVNNGAISVGGGETINSSYYQADGTDTASGGYFVTTANGKVENAGITSGQEIQFSAGILKLDNSALSAGGQLNFNVTNSLYDSGGSANNNLICGDGFNLWIKPTTGDLLGTAITSQAFNGAEVDTVWAGEDLGATNNAGYTNNVAIGTLTLSPQGTSYFPPLFYFSGATANNALYVDMLDLSQITNLEEMVETDPNLVIYYAAAKLPSQITVSGQVEVETNNSFNGQPYYVVANGVSGQVPQEAEEVLNGRLGGHLRWVSSFAGPNSSVDVIINGQTYSVNRALRYSLAIDSNGDGIPNGVDPNPFNEPPMVLTGALLQANPPTGKTFAVSWKAETNIIYHVQYSTNLSSTNWLPLLNYTNPAPTNRTVTVWDTNALPGQRFYRVWHLPPSP